MKAKMLVLAIATGMILTGCVTGRQYEELQALKNDLDTQNDELSKNNESLTTENRELSSQLDDANERLTALETDTTLMGNSLRKIQDQYDKINELNDILASKNSKLLREAAEENRALLNELEQTRLELQAKEDSLLILESEIDKKANALNNASSALEDREARVHELERLIAAKDSTANALKNKVSAALLGFKDKGLTIEQRNGKVYVSLEAKLLFPSGSTVINDEGKKALVDLAKAIEDQADLEIVVEGHTDTDAIKSSSIPRNNWELSVLRSTAVIEIMVANSKIEPSILAASGRSEFHPVDPEDKAKNRRIEIILSPNLNELYELIEE
ncbi:MAG: OmpA family protein [Flavobacteriales bacterium]|nr:OmpA family protein [Flavobacteriales bacterium]